MTVRSALRSTAWKAIGSDPACRAVEKVLADRLVVTAYHGVPDPRSFAKHLDHYVDHFSVVDIDQVAAFANGDVPLPERSLLLTFDDGDRTVYEHAFPLLAERRLPAAVFVVTDLIDTDQPFWWSEVEELVQVGGGDGAASVRRLKEIPNRDRIAAIEQMRSTAVRAGRRHRQLRSEELVEMHAAGVTIGNHTASHPLLDRCDHEEVRREVTAAHERLSSILGRAPRCFAYPNGNLDERVPPLLRELGYQSGFAFDHRRVSGAGLDPLSISRVRVDATAPLHEVRAITSGLHPLVHNARQAIRRR